MSEIKLIQILRTFSNEEFASFKKFASSPYFNEGRNLIPLINVLKKFHPEYDESKFKKDLVFEALYPGEKFKPALLDKLFSRTTKLAEYFLIQISNEKNEIRNYTLLAKEYSNRNIGKLFNMKLAEAEKILEKNSEYSLEYFEAAKELEIIKTDFLLANKDYYGSSKNLPLRGELNLLDFLIKYIHSEMDILIVGYETNNDFSQSIVSRSTDFINIEGMIKLLEEKNNKYTDVLKLKYFELLAIKYTDKKHFFQYKDLVEKNFYRFQWSEKFNRLLTLLSACNLGVRKRKEEFLGVQLELARFIVDQNVHAINEKLNTYLPLYINLLGTFKQNMDSDYIDRLILNFGSKIEPDLKDSCIAFSYINRYIVEKNFSEALKYLSKVNFEHSLIKVGARTDAIMIYYELGYEEELLSLIESTLKYLKSIDNQQQFRIESAINFTKFIKQIVKIKQTNEKDSLNVVKSEIINSSKVMMKNWLLEKLDALK